MSSSFIFTNRFIYSEARAEEDGMYAEHGRQGGAGEEQDDRQEPAGRRREGGSGGEAAAARWEEHEREERGCGSVRRGSNPPPSPHDLFRTQHASKHVSANCKVSRLNKLTERAQEFRLDLGFMWRRRKKKNSKVGLWSSSLSNLIVNLHKLKAAQIISRLSVQCEISSNPDSDQPLNQWANLAKRLAAVARLAPRR